MDRQLWKYDSRNRKIYESVGNCTTKGWTYYSYGKVMTEHTGCSIDADGNVSGGIKTYFSYDNYGRLSEKAYPDGRKESYSYDKKDNIISITYADESSKKYEYNTLGFVTKETDEEDKVTEHYYNVWGEETYRIENNVDGNIEWEIYYDIYGQKTKETQNTSRVWTYAYDERGLLIKNTDPKGIETVFSYDKCGRLLNQNSEYGEQTAVKSYEYDRLGNLTKGTDGAVVSSITCDNAYALPVQYITKVNSTEMKTEYGYDNGQRLNYIKYHDSREFNFTYNTAGFLTSIGKGQATGSDLTAYASGGTYDSSGHLNKLTTGSGLDRTESWNAQTGNLDSYSWGISGNSGNSIVWNNRGNITRLTKNGIQNNYLYDHKNQLTNEKQNNSENIWEYDAKGNRKKTNGKAVTCYQYSDLIKKDGTWYYNYDRNGNLVAKGKSAAAKTGGELYEGWSFSTGTGEIWQYEYDNFNRLVRVKKSTAGTNNLEVKEINTYDYRDLLVYRKCGTVKEYFEYMGDGTLIYEKKGNSYRDYVYANGKIWCEIRDENVYYHHTDYLGTTEYITDANASIIWSCEYEAFGKVVTKTDNSFVPCYTGKMLDEVTGLYYFNARWYDSDAGRFINEDPARDGLNWYIYCLNNPLVCIDPNGLYSWEQFKKEITPAINYDFGRDYANAAEQAWKNRNYLKAALFELDATCEMAYDGILLGKAAYKGAKALDATIKAGVMLKTTLSALSSSSTVVLGRYAEGSCGGYTKMAEEFGASYFQLPDKMFKILEKVPINDSNLGKIINEKWLDGVMNSGAKILLNFDPAAATEGTAYYMEVQKMAEKGYEFSKTIVKGIECWEATK